MAAFAIAAAQAQEPVSNGLLRIATYNASLNRTTAGRLASDLATTGNAQARQVAEIVQRVRPDVLLLNEFDYDAAGLAAQRFQTHYLAVSQNGFTPIAYPHQYHGPVNTGVPSGLDFNNDGRTNGADDAYGYGAFPGQYGMLVLSRYPIRAADARTFRNFLWRDMPGALLPTTAGSSYYASNELAVFRLSSKSHWDLPIEVGAGTIHLLAAHPTPPVFDGIEDRNGKRNHDEIRLWTDYIDPARGGYLVDDAGRTGTLHAAAFVIVGDYNADPNDGDSYGNAARQFTQHARLNQTVVPASAGGLQSGAAQGHAGNPANDTSSFGGTTGNLRVDYALPSTALVVRNAGIFWPRTDQPGHSLIAASDHRLVWIDLDIRPFFTGLCTRVY